MKATTRTLKPTFANETWFEITPQPVVPFRGTQETALEALKDRLLLEQLNSASDYDLYVPIRRAANEAAALAWSMPYSMLLLPELLGEKVDEARRQYGRQLKVWILSRELFKAVA